MLSLNVGTNVKHFVGSFATLQTLPGRAIHSFSNERLHETLKLWDGKITTFIFVFLLLVLVKFSLVHSQAGAGLKSFITKLTRQLQPLDMVRFNVVSDVAQLI